VSNKNLLFIISQENQFNRKASQRTRGGPQSNSFINSIKLISDTSAALCEILSGSLRLVDFRNVLFLSYFFLPSPIVLDYF
jgi:hypothetical protein